MVGHKSSRRCLPVSGLDLELQRAGSKQQTLPTEPSPQTTEVPLSSEYGEGTSGGTVRFQEEMLHTHSMGSGSEDAADLNTQLHTTADPHRVTKMLGGFPS